MTRTNLFFAFALVLMPLAVLSAPAPTDKLHLAPAGTVKVDNLVVNDAALIDENRVVLVGRTGDFDPAKDAPNEGKPNGAIIDLAKKSVQPFTNGHKIQIWAVSSYGDRVFTGGTDLEPFVRIWDLAAGKTTHAIKIEDNSCRVCCFHKSDRVVSDGLLHLVVLDPAKPRERTKLSLPEVEVWFCSTRSLTVSHDDAWVACTADQDQVACFDVATGMATAVRITPERENEKWLVYGLTFSPSGKLFVCRGGLGAEVPRGKAEKDVAAERRGIVRIDLPEGKVVPLNMGHTFGTFGCAVDDKEIWLATVGKSRSDKQPKGKDVGEVRVYNLASGKLVYREQLEGTPLWVWFTPSGKRLVCVTSDGRVRWWDVPVR